MFRMPLTEFRCGIDRVSPHLAHHLAHSFPPNGRAVTLSHRLHLPCPIIRRFRILFLQHSHQGDVLLIDADHRLIVDTAPGNSEHCCLTSDRQTRMGAVKHRDSLAMRAIQIVFSTHPIPRSVVQSDKTTPESRHRFHVGFVVAFCPQRGLTVPVWLSSSPSEFG